ncbi:CHAT domain-containing protein [Streptomyces zhihengii]|uniref:CHAT domain-containing protein n=1 Tax=Streptomyces zhihengii TaxID=1818004 RepID=UPI001FD49C12|nr:CHAT domain-containing protein [Streptomyces zhihengii]
MGEQRYRRYDLDGLERDVRRAVRQGVSSAEDLARIASLITDRLGAGTPDEAWTRLCADFRAGTRGTPRSGIRAGQILRMMPYLGFAGPLSDDEARVDLCEEAVDHGPDDPGWKSWVVLLSASHGMRIGTSRPDALERELATVERVRGTVPAGTDDRYGLDLVRAFIRFQLGVLGGEDDLDAAVEEIAALRQAPVADAETGRILRGSLATLRVQQALRRADEKALAQQVDELDAVQATLPFDHPARLRFEIAREMSWEILQTLRAARGAVRLPGGDRPVRTADAVRAQARSFAGHVRLAVLCEAGVARLHRAVATDDPAGAREALSLLGDGLGLLAPDDLRWAPYAYQFGWGHCWIAERDGLGPLGSRGSADQGIDWLTRAVGVAGGPDHPLWAGMCFTLAEALHTRAEAFPREPSAPGDLDAARRTGAAAVDGALWNVLLQSGTDHAAESARMVGRRAVDIAGWCLAAGAHTGALRTLEAGRGLTLHAATVGASVPEMLDAVGRPDLAGEWRTSGALMSGSAWSVALPLAGTGTAGPSSRLRRRVLEVLENSPYRARLRDVPSPDGMAGALRAMGRTALVYLLPGSGGRPGAALVITCDGDVRPVPLPNLDLAAPELVGYGVTGDAKRLAGGPPGQDATPSGDPGALDRLSDWAGRTVMAPLLDAVSRPDGRTPSLVLVPMGELGAVPWHAARLPSGRYACQEAEISYMPSARLLCEVAGRRPTGVRRAVVVGDPTGDLVHAGAEARAIHRASYPEGTLLGTATATPATVAGRVARQGGGVLHLACHGTVEAGRRHSSYLELSGGRLPAEELTEGASRLRDLELVVLAACRTNVSGHGYDEAYSLSTAFLVAGARSVVGSLWPVPDDATSLLMYMTHHYLSREGLPPGSALRRAQLWMLDTGRQAPPGMPTDMVARVGDIKADDLVGWAGFTHLGW